MSLGIPAVILFGLPATKDEVGSENFAPDGIVQQALRRLRARHPDLLLATDVCCCEYTSHGHCGIVRDGAVDNDATLEVLGRVAKSHAEAGADVLAPSGMMDGMVRAIRVALDGADLLMVKPALAYLDVVRAVRERSTLPLVTYNVSGEYAMVKAAARLGWIDERKIVLEALTAMRRAGADAIITYHAKDAARWLSE